MTSLPPSPFHPGEVAIQERLGVADQMAAFGRKVVRSFMPDQHRDFYAQLPFIVVATVDAEGRPWASLLEGRPGFLHSPDPGKLDFNAALASDDPAAAGWKRAAAVGLLGIELHSRRRNRVNGVLRGTQGGGLQLEVEHAFGNCPQYIQARNLDLARDPVVRPGGSVRRGHALLDEVESFISEADTFFVASYVDHVDRSRAVDASHRGGKPGFVRVAGQRLSIPDYAGNLHFNTLGNFVLNPRAGLLFVDFACGDLLQLSGKVTLDLASDQTKFFQGAERLWHVDVEQWVLRRGALALRGGAGQMSMNSAMTGTWAEVGARQQADAMRERWRPFRVTRIEDESSVIKSFWLEPADGVGLGQFQAGQHLPVRKRIGNREVERSYTLSVAPSDGAYRLSVRRQGVFSNHLHDAVKPGDLIEGKAPRGSFTVDALEARPLVLLSAGVGITPMLAMLRHVVHEGIRKRRIRPTWFIHGARDEKERGFAAEVAQVADAGRGAVTVVQVLKQPGESAQQGRDYDATGWIDLPLLKSALPWDDFDFYLCGPAPFMQALYSGLRSLNVPESRIHSEAFGPAGLRREDDAEMASISSIAVPVFFAASGKEVRWTPGSGSLLELAESRGLNPSHSCRQGMCGSCSTALMSGSVAYTTPPAGSIDSGQVLLCQAQPAAGTEAVVVDV